MTLKLFKEVTDGKRHPGPDQHFSWDPCKERLLGKVRAEPPLDCMIPVGPGR